MKTSTLAIVFLSVIALFFGGISCKHGHGGGGGGGGPVYPPAPSSGGSSGSSGSSGGSSGTGNTTPTQGMVLLTGGTFMMGRGYSTGIASVTLTQAFYICDHEVTQGEYEQYCTYGAHPSIPAGYEGPLDYYGKGSNYPAYHVSWYDALVYCNRCSMAEGLTPVYSIGGSTNPTAWGPVPTTPSNSTWNAVTVDWSANGYRLPTDAEWEYAARAGDNTTDVDTWSGTSSESLLGNYAWYSENSGISTHPVKTKLPNAWGLYDMSGNVMEWCWDWDWYLSSGTLTDPTGPSSGSLRTYRTGNCWNNAATSAVSSKLGNTPDIKDSRLGFRVVRTAQ